MRWAPLSGVGFVVSFVAAVLLYGSGAGRQPGEIAAFYASHSDRARQIAGFYVLAAGVLLFVWFAGVMSRRLDAPLILAAGVVSGSLLIAADALWGGDCRHRAA